VTILLLGSDEGPGQHGTRTDTMIVAALQRRTGRGVLLGIPRNFVNVPLPGKRVVFRQPLNHLWSVAERHPASYDGPATALKQTISELLGIRIEYYALVDLAGFADMVDALGGVEILVKERIVDEVTRPKWGEHKPRIDVYPGRTYHFGGRTALAYVRSRKASSDYARMARQRCFLTAMAEQLDVLWVLRNFGTISEIATRSVRTDIPLSRVPDLVRLAGSVDAARVRTTAFGPEYIVRRRKVDGFPVPDVAKIRTATRAAILLPPGAGEERIATAKSSC
jgi:LCP family protein required for cell wall assembly